MEKISNDTFPLFSLERTFMERGTNGTYFFLDTSVLLSCNGLSVT